MKGVDGTPITLECEFDFLSNDDDDIKVEWLKDGKPVKPNKDTAIKWNSPVAKLEIRELLYPDDTGFYTCKVTNESGTAETSATLTVQGIILHQMYT